MINGTIKEEKEMEAGDLVMKQISIRRFIMTKSKLKFIKGLIFFVIAMVSIDFIVSKIFKSEFSIYQNIIIGIAAYIGYYFATKKK